MAQAGARTTKTISQTSEAERMGVRLGAICRQEYEIIRLDNTTHEEVEAQELQHKVWEGCFKDSG